MEYKNHIVWFKSLVFLLIFSSLFLTATYIFRDKHCAESFKPFYDEPKDSIDVVFVGSSQMMNGVYPLELWNQYGMASYNLGFGGESITMSYWAIRDAIKTQHPKLIVLDVYNIRTEEKQPGWGRTQQIIDNMDMFSKTKYQAINDAVGGSYLEKSHYYINFILYHSRWKSLEGKDFSRLDGYEKGSLLGYKIMDISEFPIIPKDNVREIPDKPLKYIDKIIQLCKSTNTELIFIKTPYYAVDRECYEQYMFNEFEHIAAKNQVPYLNFFHSAGEWGFNYKEDMADELHLNWKGAKKLTSYLGRYIKNNYEIPDRRSDASYEQWNQDYQKYVEVDQRRESALVNADDKS